MPYQSKRQSDRQWAAHRDTEYLGSFVTKEEAALAYARALGPEASAAQALKEPALTAEEVVRLAEDEQLQLVRST
eukprot:1208627-Prymnesium_polylepis.1